MNLVSIRFDWKGRSRHCRRELARVEVAQLYEFFKRQVGKRSLRDQTDSEFKLAMERFAECANELRARRNGYAMTNEEWVEQTARLFEKVIVALCEDPYGLRTKTWRGLCDANSFRFQIVQVLNEPKAKG